MIMNVNIMCPLLPTEWKVVLDYSYTQAPCDFYLLLSLSSLFPGLTSALAQLHSTSPASSAGVAQKHSFNSQGSTSCL